MKITTEVLDDREVLIFEEGNFFEVCKDNLVDENDKDFCLSISKEKAEMAGVAIGIPFEDLKNVLENNSIKTVKYPLLFSTIFKEIKVKEDAGNKIIKISYWYDGDEIKREGTFELPKSEVETILNFCKEHM